MGKLNLVEAGPATFVTLTYPDDFPADRAVWRAHRDEFFRRVRRQFPMAWGLWRREMRLRLSGKNAGKWAPHFHLLLWGVPRTWQDPRGGQLRWDFERTRHSALCARIRANPGKPRMVRREVSPGVYFTEPLQLVNVSEWTRAEDDSPYDEVCDVELLEWVSVQWYHLVGSHDLRHFSAGTRVEAVENERGVFAYVGKYIAKTDEEPPGEVDRGRQWGVVGLARFNWAIVERLPLSQEQFYRLRRPMRRYLEREVKRRVGLGRWHGMAIFTRPECWLALVYSTR
jgi:hypothetical protein